MRDEPRPCVALSISNVFLGQPFAGLSRERQALRSEPFDVYK